MQKANLDNNAREEYSLTIISHLGIVNEYSSLALLSRLAFCTDLHEVSYPLLGEECVKNHDELKDHLGLCRRLS